MATNARCARKKFRSSKAGALAFQPGQLHSQAVWEPSVGQRATELRGAHPVGFLNSALAFPSGQLCSQAIQEPSVALRATSSKGAHQSDFSNTELAFPCGQCALCGRLAFSALASIALSFEGSHINSLPRISVNALELQ